MATRAELEHEIAVLAVDLKKATDSAVDADVRWRNVEGYMETKTRLSAAEQLYRAKADCARAELAIYLASARLEALDG